MQSVYMLLETAIGFFGPLVAISFLAGGVEPNGKPKNWSKIAIAVLIFAGTLAAMYIIPGGWVQM